MLSSILNLFTSNDPKWKYRVLYETYEVSSARIVSNLDGSAILQFTLTVYGNDLKTYEGFRIRLSKCEKSYQVDRKAPLSPNTLMRWGQISNSDIYDSSDTNKIFEATLNAAEVILSELLEKTEKFN
jgi:hypothetical protein